MRTPTLDELSQEVIESALENALLKVGRRGGISLAHLGRFANNLDKVATHLRHSNKVEAGYVTLDFHRPTSVRAVRKIDRAKIKQHRYFRRVLRTLIRMAQFGAFPVIQVTGSQLKVSFVDDPTRPEGIKRQVRHFGFDPTRLAIIVDVGLVPVEVVVRLLAALDRVHQAWGGGGLELESVDIFSIADATAAV